MLMIQSDHELARAEAKNDLDDAHELADHEFTLDPEDDPSQASSAVGAAAKRPTSPPPPPPRKQPRQLNTAILDAFSPRSRSLSGIFPLFSSSQNYRQALADAEGELQRLRTQMRARDAYLRELEHALASSTRQLSAAGLETPEDAARLLGRVRGQAFRIAELESELRQSRAGVTEPRAALRAGEELQRVRGIGRRFAEQLHELGYGTLARMAACGDAEIALIAKRLRITRERVVRERWVEQASMLLRSESNPEA